MILKSINPYTNETVSEIREQSDEDVKAAITRADEASEEWKNTTFDFRKKIMLRLAENLKNGKELLARTISVEMGKPKSEAIGEIEKCAWVCEYYANDAEILLHEKAVYTDAYYSYVSFEPLGIILGIMPWNYPFWQVFRFAIPTIMAGNVVLLKHASNVQLCAKAIVNEFNKAGLPAEVFQNLSVSSAKVKPIIENNLVKAVSLTGSIYAGSEVAALAGKSLKKTVLELGGSNAFVVMKDSSLEEAVKTGVKSRMQNAGQSCIAAKRFLIHKDITDKFIESFVMRIKELKQGNPLDTDTDMGPLASRKQADKVRSQVEESVKMGARIIHGGNPQKAFYPPTVVTGVKPGMPLFDEEVFGPVAPIMEFESDEEAIRLSNRSRYGLGVSLFTNNLEKAEKLASQFEEGAVFINDMVKSDPRLPFGGVKDSGYGRELAEYGIHEFLNTKTNFVRRLQDTSRKPKSDKKVVISVGSQNA